jgi:hypothetical protein
MIYITTIRIGDGSWNGSAASFVLNWQDKVREFEKLSDTKNHFSDEWKLIMLQNAVHPLSELCQVKTTADQNKVAGIALTYESYFKLLYSAAISYDEQFTHKWSTRQSAFTHDMCDSDALALPSDGDFNIDTGVDTILAHMANRPMAKVRLPSTQWYELSSEARDLWQSLPEADKAITLGSTSKKSATSSSHRSQRTSAPPDLLTPARRSRVMSMRLPLMMMTQLRFLIPPRTMMTLPTHLALYYWPML